MFIKRVMGKNVFFENCLRLIILTRVKIYHSIKSPNKRNGVKNKIKTYRFCFK